MAEKTSTEHATHILTVLGFTGQDLDLQTGLLATYLDTYVLSGSPHPDDDGACSRCGLAWQEEGITDHHECPPGFGHVQGVTHG